MKSQQKIVLVGLIFILVGALYASCPTPTAPAAWQNGLNIGYSWPYPSSAPSAFTVLSVDSLGIGSDINSAFNQWGYANQSQNSTQDTFYYSPSGVPIRVYVYQINNPGVAGEDPGVAAQYTAAVFAGTSTLAVQDIYLYFGSINSFGIANWDQNALSFHTFVQQTLVHEIGHGMGLYDQPVDTSNPNCAGQIAGESVMNANCGTNDSQGNLPPLLPGVTNCDNASVW